MAASSIVPHKSLAVVLHGRMGGMASLVPGAPGRPLRSFDGAVPSPSSAALCAASLEQHVIGPNRAHFAVDVFGHSWSPEIGATLDGLFAPRRSLHEEGISKANFRCPDPNFSHGYCHRTVSHLLGIARAMRLKKLEEIARGREYDVVFLSRWDILWRTPLLELRAVSALLGLQLRDARVQVGAQVQQHNAVGHTHTPRRHPLIGHATMLDGAAHKVAFNVTLQ